MRKTTKWFLCLALIVAVVCGAMTAFAQEQTYVAENVQTGQQYEDVSAALQAATEGQTVKLLQDTEAKILTVGEKTTLDLNGYELTATYASVFGNMIDGSAENTGALKVDDNKLLINTENKQLPVKTDKGYRFVEIVGFNTAWVNDSTFVFQPLFEAAACDMLKNGAAATGVSIQINVTWRPFEGSEDLDSRTFKYGDKLVTQFVNSYNASTGKFGRMFTLTLVNPENYVDLKCNTKVVSTTRVEFVPAKGSAVLKQEVLLNNEQASAIVAEGTKVQESGMELILSTTEMETSTVVVGEGETARAMDIHVAGIAKDNTVPVIVTVNEMAPEFMNRGNITLYHVENGEAVEMTRVYTIEEVDTHNEYYYDIETGTVTMALKSFSEVTAVSSSENTWNGKLDYTWYDASKTELKIANADQLAAFGTIVGGMAGDDITRDTFEGKKVTLIADIDLGDKNNANGELIFYPIGYYYNGDSSAPYSTVYSFKGTFDGNGHTIANFYQNTWEIKGDYDGNYYKDAMGLFGYVVNGTVKNLTVDNFSSDGEFTPTGVIAAYAENSTFENIAITNCNPRVYNTGNGGIIGIGGRTDDTSNQKLVLKNITVDNTNKISALWGSWDVACGGLVGMFRGNAAPGNGTIHFENCHVAAEIDVYNDVCANYQYYAYRYSGMLIGSVRHNETVDGKVYPVTKGITADNCTVKYDEWVNYYYCELVSNSIASYTHDYQFSRLVPIASLDEIKSGDTWTKTGNYVLVENGQATCYHIVKDGDTLEQHNHIDSGYETVGNQEVLVENNQCVYLPFPEQLFTGYSWGVTSKVVGDFEGTDSQIKVSEGQYASSVRKFEGVAAEPFETGAVISIGELFKSTESSVGIVDKTVQVFVSPADENSTVSGAYTAGGKWNEGTLVLSGSGNATITISDYFFCTPTTITVNIADRQPVDKFTTVFEHTDKFLYRVGNAENSTVKLGQLFKALDNVTINDQKVEVTITGSAATGVYTPKDSWANGEIQFSGTGPVKVTITDNDYCKEYTLNLEVVTAKNCTTASAPAVTANSVVLLNDVSGSFSVSGGNTLYGNGFAVTLPTTVQSKYSSGYVGYVTMSGGNLDNVRIVGPAYTERTFFREQAKDSKDETKANYFYNSILINGGNNTIVNSYISGSRTAICIRGGNKVVIDNTTLHSGAVANLEIAGASEVILRDITTVQVNDDKFGAYGTAIYVTTGVADIYIQGVLNQYNWVNQKTWDDVVPYDYKSSFPDFFGNEKYRKYWHNLNDGTDMYVNLGFVFACNWDTAKIHDERAVVDYETTAATLNGVDGGVYSKVNTVGDNKISDTNLSDPGYSSPGFDPVAPVFSFDNTANNDADDENDAADTYCVYDDASGILKIGITGDNKILDLSGVSITKDGATLTKKVYLNGAEISGNSVTIKAADGAKQTLVFKTSSNSAGYDNDGNAIAGKIEYSWTVTIELATLAYPAPVWNMGGDYQFGVTNCYYAYFKTSQGYGEAVPIYEGIKVSYYNGSGVLVNLDLSGTTTHPTGSKNSNANAFTYTLSDGSTLAMKFSSGWKSGATNHQFTTYENKVYIYPQALDSDNYVRSGVKNQDFDVKITYTFTDPNGQSTETVTMNWYNAKASNGSVSTVQWKTFDSTNGKENECITEGTLITMADGTQKAVEDLVVGDMVLAFNHVSGQFEAFPIIFNNHSDQEAAEYEVLNLVFSNGKEVEIVASHGFFDTTLMQYVYITYDNYQDYIGHEFYYAGSDGTAAERITLTNAFIETEVTRVFCPVSYFHMNSIANGFLNTPNIPGDITGLVNYFEYDEDLKYNEEAMRRDIETYGLYSYEDFSDYISEAAYNSSPSVYLKVAVGKGMITYEQIIDVIEYLLEGSLIN